MDQQRRQPNDAAPGAPDRDLVALLLRLAGPRPEVPVERARRVKQAVQEHWAGQVRTRRRRRLGWSSAALTAAAAAALWSLGPSRLADRPAAPLATVASVTGPLVAVHSNGDRLPVGAPLYPGAVLQTGPDARAALALSGGRSMRLDHGTRLALDSPASIVLHAGAVYLDSGGRPGQRAVFEVRTDRGAARELGTQFEVRIEAEALRVRVREGAVELARDQPVRVEAGSELRVDADGRISRSALSPHDPSWQWVLEAAPPFELEGHSLGAFLAWVGRETGWRIRFTDRELGARVAAIELHGSIAGLTPDQTPAAVLPTCGLSHRLLDGVLRIDSR